MDMPSATRRCCWCTTGGGAVRVIETVAADKGYDACDFVETIRAMGVRPHVMQNNTNRRSAIDARTTRHSGYAVSQKKRPFIERTFGWLTSLIHHSKPGTNRYQNRH